MEKEQERLIAELVRAARERARGYADHFDWATDRDLEEWGVVESLNEAFQKAGHPTFQDIHSRGRGNDPPDCEAFLDEQRVAIEVTELVSGKAVQAFKAGQEYIWADWDREDFTQAVSDLVVRKHDRFPALKGGPYPGGYVLVIFTDEPKLNKETVAEYFEHFVLPACDNLTRIYFLISYDPEIGTYPYFQLK